VLVRKLFKDFTAVGVKVSDAGRVLAETLETPVLKQAECDALGNAARVQVCG
jgi:hypothetical protein